MPSVPIVPLGAKMAPVVVAPAQNEGHTAMGMAGDTDPAPRATTPLSWRAAWIHMAESIAYVDACHRYEAGWAAIMATKATRDDRRSDLVRRHALRAQKEALAAEVQELDRLCEESAESAAYWEQKFTREKARSEALEDKVRALMLKDAAGD